ncbi:probable LRR receptor-like serine/threonine-protein kinase At1g51860 [Panicum virgatum]|uniref:probable LRR receptor-like serine/threonine-protein kinase At1g51860 n=1 Tax=Panicum virgatum TaxID=38727 RepID=UPI0019D6768A|nr:probable LRR receptor-like serine/threonine-protein kinase At1g51860 [Panicum virgatum]
MAASFLIYFAATAIVFVLAPTPAVLVAAQLPAGSLSIDCGLDANSGGYRDKSTGIDYVPDGPYVDAGENHAVASEYQLQPALPRSYLTLRSFPLGVRNCYELPTAVGSKYLARMEAFYGNYDGRGSSSSPSSSPAAEFDLYLGADYWDTAKVGTDRVYEAVFVAWAAWTPLCLVNTNKGTPFVSAVELRPLAAALYPPVAPGLSMAMYNRLNMGASTSFARYPADQYDRFWYPMSEASPRWANLSTGLTIRPDPTSAEPLAVLQTAVAAAGNDTELTAATWTVDERRASFSFMVFVHFADFQSTQLREFDIYLNNNRRPSPLSPQAWVASCIYTTRGNWAADGTYNVTLVATNQSVLPPMINALEIYSVILNNSPTTFADDIDAIMAIKFEYGVKKNWMGDPCFPVIYAWHGVKCSNTSGNTTRITSLDLSNSNLRGAISTNFTLLTALEFLNLSGNHLSGNSLCKNYTGSLILRYDSDKSRCSKTTSRSTKAAVVLVTSIVVPVLVVAALFLAYFIWRAKRKPHVSIADHSRIAQLDIIPRRGTNQGDHLQDTENRRFTYKELEKITDNFKRFIGQGGFGLVYYGHLEDGTEVAVKMRSESSSHGLDEFLAEVQSLTKVHHRNIVSLVGYCWDKEHLALVYEYMSHGNLYDHLRGKNADAETLSWGTRVRVVLEAAQGLDYLHKGCSPPIIHRDVKSSNILLGQNLQAKIADLGLSRTYLSDVQTHISATAAGTAGYMDPEYYMTGRLTETSDVYSFGVVLLEAATGEAPLVPSRGHIVQRVKQSVATTGDIGAVADPRLGGAYDVSSMWKVVDTAMACVAEAGAGRPTMAEVVMQLRDSLALEEACGNDDRSFPAASDSSALMSGFGPLAR